ncbi:MAG: UPF0175 family protein [bacterium]
MNEICLKLPETVKIDINELKIIVATRFYEKGSLSLGQGADIANVSKRTFIELLGKYGVSLFNYSPEELEEDLKNA